jgi:hypothetical protein
MRMHMTDADKGVLGCASCAIGLAPTAPIVLRRLRTRWVSRIATPCQLPEGLQS